MKVAVLLAKIVSWYNPAAQADRDRRALDARNRAISVRIRSERVDQRLQNLQESYRSADSRLSRQRRRGR